VEKDSADTAKSGVGVLDRNGTVRTCDSAGIRIRTPKIGGGVGAMRTRYPIMAVHGEGSGVWKELNALKDMTMQINKYGSLFEDNPRRALSGSGNGTDQDDGLIRMRTATTYRDPPGEHYHQVVITKAEAEAIRNHELLIITTSEEAGHVHELKLAPRNKMHEGKVPFRIQECDKMKKGCWDGHTAELLFSDD